MTLLVATIFRNEAAGMNEWLQHYLNRNVDHIFMINDRSTDNWRDIAGPYMEDGIVTVVDAKDIPMIPNRQVAAYNKLLGPFAKNFDWVSLLDLDEYLWCPESIGLKSFLPRRHDLKMVPVYMDDFGDNGFISQPDNIVESFIRREKRPKSRKLANGNGFKAIVRPETVRNYHFHIPFTESVGMGFDNREEILLDELPYRLNHYKLQSRERWDNVVVPRGSANLTLSGAARKTPEYFERFSPYMNAVVDLGLLKQNQRFFYGKPTAEGNRLTSELDATGEPDPDNRLDSLAEHPD